MDAEGTGLLTGTPDVSGKAEVEVTAAIDEDVRTYDLNALMWGSEKVEVSTKRMGPANQRSVVDARP